MFSVIYFIITPMQNNTLNNFIVFEGLDGAGTTTQSKLIAQNINNSIFTFEPTDNHIGKLLRKILKKEIDSAALSITYLFMADRAEHIFGENGVVELCNQNKIVVSDRYLFSTLAYQSLTMDFDELLLLNKNFPLPKILFFLDTDMKECQKRVNHRGEKKEIYENLDIQEKVYKNYKKVIKQFENSDMIIKILDGNKSEEELLHEELSIISEYLNIGHF